MKKAIFSLMFLFSSALFSDAYDQASDKDVLKAIFRRNDETTSSSHLLRRKIGLTAEEVGALKLRREEGPWNLSQEEQLASERAKDKIEKWLLEMYKSQEFSLDGFDRFVRNLDYNFYIIWQEMKQEYGARLDEAAAKVSS
ncbi:hypothetical protein A3F66_03535 [candidate division TM6 bacterium RIFCSPHIGHO2_12_FULL_32_22]|nr:MAG: hypothetical protein A3F66_03535 [candidate division TM6 bacterium RIFCSPHIGHO2_12_FULL_32_22]